MKVWYVSFNLIVILWKRLYIQLKLILISEVWE